MGRQRFSRRRFLNRSLRCIAAGTGVPNIWTSHTRGEDKNSRPNFALVGCGNRGRTNARSASLFADVVACADVDQERAGKYAQGHKIKAYSDFRKMYERNDVDFIVNGTPDHWHTGVNVAALQAGMHVYAEKPLTLTIDEGKVLCRVLEETGPILQVGSQQRSAPWFRRAVAIARSGLLGSTLTAVVALGRGRAGGPFRETIPPAGLDWDFWLGQAPAVPYIPERCHKSFRWWSEYSGGEVTNWGAHHLDIAQWALGAESTGPFEIEGHGVFDERPNCYNTAQSFNCTLKFGNGNKIILTSGKDGILFEGENEHIYVNRGRITGNLLMNMTAEMQSQIDAELARLYGGPLGKLDEEIFTSNEFTKEQFLTVDISHMENFINCIRENTQPISDVPSTHRTITSCHLTNIAMRLERKLRWDPVKEDFINDLEASSMIARRQRAAYAIG